jgi:hypothetical protein
MASPVGYTTDRPTGLSHSVEKFRHGNRDRKLASSKGFSSNRVTIIGDSIIQRMEELLYVSVQGVPGAYLSDMISMCQQGRYDIDNFEGVIVMSGTNDFSRDCTQQHMLDLYTAVVHYIRAVNPTTRIAICGILPRPCDAWDPRTSHRLKNRILLNTALLLHCQSLGVAYFKSDKALKGKGSDSYLFHTDYLHLSDHGLHFLKIWLEGRVACLVGSPPQVAN